MSWMFRWLDSLLARLRDARSADKGWVEPSNAITRAILGGAIAQLAIAAPEPALAISETAAIPEPAQPAIAAPVVTRTAQRTRRRRATRAA